LSEVTAPVLRSSLADVLGPIAPATDQARAGVRVAEWAHVACLVVRGHRDDSAVVRAVHGATGVTLPLQPSAWASGKNHVIALWVSPDEWWLLAPRVARDGLVAALRSATAGLHAQVADNSGGIALLRVAGPEHTTLLRHLTPYDTERISIGRCVWTAIPKATLSVIRADDAGVMLLFRRSFADWVWRLVERSARPYGLAVCMPSQLPAPAFSALLADADVSTALAA
jgi:sarcosine oxidase, subunit gamma